MYFPGREWSVVRPEAEALDSTKLQAAVDFLKAQAGRDGVRELLIIRNGRVVWEGDAVTNVHGVWSVTKSFTSTCLGLLMDDGRCSLDALAASLVPALATNYGGVTLRHFTTMTSGYRAVGDEPRGDGYSHGPSNTPFAPGPQRLFAPGAAYAYWDSAMNMLGLGLTRAAGEPLDQLFRRRIADPISMNAAGWRWGDFGEIGGIRVNSSGPQDRQRRARWLSAASRRGAVGRARGERHRGRSREPPPIRHPHAVGHVVSGPRSPLRMARCICPAAAGL